VNRSANEQGLQFDVAGGRIELPGSVSTVELRVGAFSGALELEGLDATGNVIAQLTVAGTNRWTDERLDAAGIVAVRFKGGGNEGAIQKISVELDCYGG